jgi:Uma2 family endonuclease
MISVVVWRKIMTLIAAKWSLDDYHQMIDAGILDDRAVELINGEIVQMSPEGVPHTFYCRETVKYLRLILGELAEVSEAHPITLPNASEPEPDIAIVQTPSNMYKTRHPIPSDIFWLIEVSNSTLVKDLGVKKDLYARSGIPEYWVMNLQANELVVFKNLTADGYQSKATFTDGFISPLAFPDISIDRPRLFR